MVATVISAVALVFAWLAAKAARETVRLTRQMRWEADLRRVIEALVAIERAARDMDMDLGERNPNLDNWTLEQRLRDAQHELERAVAFPWFDYPNTEALELVEELRAANFLASEPAQVQETARKATMLLATMPPPTARWPSWYLRMITFGARRRARRLDRAKPSAS